MSNPNARRPMEILLVEDSLSDARVTLESLKAVRPQHRLTLVRDGAEALEFLYQEGRFVRTPRPDLILLDIMMPKLSGFEVCSQLKSDPATSGIMILMVTALNELGDIERAVEAGTDDFLSKPVNKVELLKRIENMLRLRHVTDEVERMRQYIQKIEERD